MSDGFQGETDLFGNPVEVGRGRGRPKHEACAETENKIKMLLLLGWSNERIAAAVGVSAPTLRKNYFRVLKLREVQRDRMLLAKAMRLWELAQAGKVAAFQEFDRLLERNDLMALDQGFASAAGDDAAAAPAAAPTPKRGKKEQAQADAAELASGSDDEWGSDLAFPGGTLN